MNDAKILQDKLKTIVKAIKSLQIHTPESQAREFKRLAVNIDRIMTTSPSQHKRVWTKVQNLMKSLSDGASTGDLTPAIFKEAIIDVDRWADDAATAENEKKTKTTKTDPGDVSLMDKWKENQDSDAVAVMRKYAPLRSKIPSNTKKRFVLERAPVLVIPSGGANLQRLKQDRLLDDQIFFYPIIRHQIVLGLSREFIAEFRSQEEAVQDVLETISDRTGGRKYQVLGPSTGFGQLQYFWIVDLVTAKRLTAGFYNKLLIKKWSFPFDNIDQPR